jgi:hypothetical protein
MMAIRQQVGAVASNGLGAWGQAPLPHSYPFVSLVYFVVTTPLSS